jgi:hypothetical protein
LRRKYFATELLLRLLPIENRVPLDFIKYSKFGGDLQGANQII